MPSPHRTPDSDLDPVNTAIRRHAEGLPPLARAAQFRQWVDEHAGAWGHIAPQTVASARVGVIDFGAETSAIALASGAGDRAAAERAYAAQQQADSFDVAVGRWMEPRCIYRSAAYESLLIPGARRDCHLGLDLFYPAGTPLRLPMAGKVVAAAVRNDAQDYGGVLVLEHSFAAQQPFWSLWGHLTHESARRWHVGQELSAGAVFAHLADFEENGWWLPHLHLQLCLALYEDFSEAPGAGERQYLDVWRDIFPDPTVLVFGDKAAALQLPA